MTLRLGDSNILLQPLCEYLGDDFVLESALVITVDPATEAQNARTDTDRGERWVWRDGPGETVNRWKKKPLETNPAPQKKQTHRLHHHLPQNGISCHPFPRKTRAASQCTFPYSSFERPSRRCPSASRHGEGSVACCGELFLWSSWWSYGDFYGNQWDLMVIEWDFVGCSGDSEEFNKNGDGKCWFTF